MTTYQRRPFVDKNYRNDVVYRQVEPIRKVFWLMESKTTIDVSCAMNCCLYPNRQYYPKHSSTDILHVLWEKLLMISERYSTKLRLEVLLLFLHLPIFGGSLGLPQSNVAYMNSKNIILPIYKYK